MQLNVAILSDKYDCTRALYSDNRRWLVSACTKDHCISSLWKSTAVAYLMYHPVQFTELASQLAQVLGADDRDGPMPLFNLPDALRGL